jgi:Ca2+-binding EF-hand superfamily protein
LAWLTLCALAAAVMGGAALADPAVKPPPPPPKLFVSPAGEPFRLSPSDPDPLKAWFDQVDTKRQGYIDRDEFRADAVRFFRKLDENGDGVIDGFEVADYEAKIAPELAEWSTGRYPGEFGPAAGDAPSSEVERRHGQPPEREVGYTPPPEGKHGHGPQSQPIAQVVDEPEPVSGADFSLDSHITLAEWMRATDDRFELLDADHTGRLTLDALRARLNAPTQRR